MEKSKKAITIASAILCVVQVFFWSFLVSVCSGGSCDYGPSSSYSDYPYPSPSPTCTSSYLSQNPSSEILPQIYTTNINKATGDSYINVYNLQDNGNVKASRQITGLKDARGIQVVNESLCVVNKGHNSIAVYKASDMDRVSPLWNISGPDTLLKGVWGIFVNQQEIYVSGESCITVYDWAPGKTNASPKRSISDVDGGFSSLSGIYVDNTYLYVANRFGKSVKVYDKSQNGSVSSAKEIYGSNTQLLEPVGIFVEEGEVFVSDAGDNSIKIYNSFGNIAPVRSIQGPDTRLNGPHGIWISDESLYVCNYKENSVTVYNMMDNGNISPKQTIQGENTGLSYPSGIYVAEKLSSLKVTEQINGVQLEWKNDSKNIIGFYIWRAKRGEENYTKITPLMIMANEAGEYSYLDRDALAQDFVYRYQLQKVNTLHKEKWDRSVSLEQK